MMELTCAFILISASFVLATPHGYGGYGVKGGASARAESSASAGAFGGVPVAVPLAAGYSGSFSKSSSSSSASSSASSSSSSSAFSYSGSGAGGFGLNGGAPGHGGCSSGNCQTAGGNGIPVPHDSSAQGYNSANAAAVAGVGAVSGSGCQGLSCDGNSEKCSTGHCKPNFQTGTPSIDSDSNKCTSGQCGSALENGASPTDYGSNDIRAVTESSDSAHNANHQSSGIDKPSSAYNGPGSDCSHGKCGPAGPSSSKPNYYGHNSGNSHLGSSASYNQQASSSDTGIHSHNQKPSPHLETPKLGSKCNSGNCNAGPHEPGHETSPSSYNVPIHGAYDKGEPKPSCDGVKCENQPKGPYSPKGPSSFDYPSSTNCAGSSCFGIPANQITGGPSLTVKPVNVNFGNSPSHVPTLSAGSNVAPGHIEHGKPSDVNNKLPNEKLPPYTGGFGGPAGVLNPNEYDVHAPTANPSYGHASTPQNGNPSGSSPAGCNSPSCSGYPSASGPTGGPVSTGTYNHRPGGDISSEKLPPYTGGFGGPTGMLKPNEFDVHTTVTNKPTYAQPASPSHNTQSPVGNIGTPGCQAGGNCGGYSSTAGATSGASAQSGYYGTTKPNNGINSLNDKQPSYTGGFGGPGGVFNPDKHDIHSTGPSSPGYTPSETYNSPASSGHPGGCKTPNCYPSLGSTAAANAQAESIGVTKPSKGPHFSSVTLPAYPSSYDRPSGVNKPNEISGPASTPSFAHTQSPSSPGSYSPGCKTGNCANYPSSGPSAGAIAQPGSYGVTKPNTDVNPAGPTHPQYTGGFGGPSGTFNPNEHNSPGCKTGNCANHPTSGPSAGANTHPGSFAVTKPNEDVNPAGPTHPQYTGGFGGPSGTLNPSEHNSPGCKTGNCANYPTSGASAGANAQSGSFSVTKPNADVNPAGPTHPQYPGGIGGPSGTFNPNEHNSPGCKTGSCANYPTSGPSASANAQPGSFGVTKPNADVSPAVPTHPQYTSGFGGIHGTFKPNEHTYVTPSTGSAPTNCKTPNCVGSPTASADAISGANAQSGSYGITKPSAGNNPSNEKPTYTGGFGGPTGLLKPNEYTVQAISPTSNNKPTGASTSAACSSGNCNPQTPHGSAPHSQNSVSSGAQATAAATAEANAVAYTGGFGGPPGVLASYDDGKIGALPSNGGQAHAAQIGGAHGSHNVNIHSQHGTIPGANGDPTGPAGAHGSTGGQVASNAGAAAYAGAAAGASAGAHEYNPHGSNHNHAGNIKSGSPCGGGCGGGAYNGGSTLEVSGGPGFPKLVLSDGLNRAGSTSGATAKSLSGANAFGVGGSYASSSASAHASAGAYTNGGYGKR